MSFLDQVQSIASGIVTEAQSFTSWVQDTRSPDLTRPRLSSTDPTSSIDSSNGTSLLSFPHDRPKYYITFGFQDYSRPSQFEGLQANSVTDYICLPIPNNLKDNNTLDWSEQKANVVVEGAAAAWNDGKISHDMTGGINTDGAADVMKGIGAGITGGFINTGVSALSSAFPQTAAGAKQILGYADNPFLTVAFSGPEFKSHSFIWRIAPKTRDESDTIKNIIQTFKKCSYPELLSAEVGGFYKYPKIVWPKFMPTEARDYLYAFKACVVTNININYSPNDRPGFFAGSSAPSEIVLEIDLKEIELWRNGGGLNPGDNNGDFSNVQNPPGVTIRDVGQI